MCKQTVTFWQGLIHFYSTLVSCLWGAAFHETGSTFSKNPETLAQVPSRRTCQHPILWKASMGLIAPEQPRGPALCSGSCCRGNLAGAQGPSSHVLQNKAGIEVVFVCEAWLIARMENIFAVFEKQKKMRVSPGVTDERNIAVLSPERDQHMTEWIDRNTLCLGLVRSQIGLQGGTLTQWHVRVTNFFKRNELRLLKKNGVIQTNW